MSLDASNHEEQFVKLFAENERQLRAFVRSMGLGWTDVDDVVQTISLVMWRKWEQFDPSTDFMRWARVIARFEVLKFRRKMARDRHVFQEDLMDLLAAAAEENHEQVSGDRYREALSQCLGKLPKKSRRLIAAAYEGEQSIKEAASELGKSAGALYKALDRVRRELHRCMMRCLQNAEI